MDFFIYPTLYYILRHPVVLHTTQSVKGSGESETKIYFLSLMFSREHYGIYYNPPGRMHRKSMSVTTEDSWKECECDLRGFFERV